MSAHISPRPLVVGETNPNPNQQTSFSNSINHKSRCQKFDKNSVETDSICTWRAYDSIHKGRTTGFRTGRRITSSCDLRQILNEKRGLANIDQRIDDNTRVANANNNEIAIVEAIKNNGDRVVDTCVQDDTLVLSANDDITSDSMVPVINLESDLASNPKLPTAGVLFGKNPSLDTIQDSCQANKVQPCKENLNQIFKSGGTCDHDFTLKDNDKEGCTEVPSKIFLQPNYNN
uniref:Uncharacterized protein n=1 Tax=Solanum tuberosum TaxID=4113 RepID=M1DJL2_SOLTU